MWSKDRLEARKKEFKSALSLDDTRKKREETTVKIRKERREENLAKRRHIDESLSTGFKVFDASTARKLEGLPVLVDLIKSDDPAKQMEATTQFRRLLSIERNPPIEEVINTGIVPILVGFLAQTDHPQLQFEAAWGLTNIASGSSEQTTIVIDNGAVPAFVQLLTSPLDDVRDQAIWALGNIAGDSPRCRDFVLQHGIMGPLLQNLMESTKLSVLRNATWTLSNLCRGKPQPPFEYVSPALPTLARLIYSTDQEILTDACWALSYLSDGSNEKIQTVIEAGVCRRMVELLMHSSYSVKTPALRTIGNIVTGDDLQTQIIINVSALPCLLALLNSPKRGTKKEACWTISNITAGNRAQIKAIIEANIIPPLIHLLANAEFDVKKEAAWAISNCTSGGSPEQINYLVQNGCIPPLCDLLSSTDTRIVMVAMEGLENILRVVGDKKGKKYAELVEAADGLDKLEQLQVHQNAEIYEKAVKILETYFAAEEEDAPDESPDEEAPCPSESGSSDPKDSDASSFSAVDPPPGGFKF